MTSSTAPTRTSRLVVVPALAFRYTPRGLPGWARILVPGALAGVSIVMGTAGRTPRLVRLVAGVGAGAVAGLLLARGADEVRWRRSAVSLEVDEPDAALDLMQAVRAEGVHADMVRAEARDRTAGAANGAYAVRYRAKDDRRVRAVFAEQQG